ncbi:MAG TPA: hemerythrin domain-containing protein, partial [Chitinophagaceae bacterium]|nr:hemerythrin domain-containing protein [Chitinophagaceae bacterium]
MFLNRLDIDSEAVLSPTGLCDLIQKEYQPEIISSCKLIEKYFSTHAYINELPSPVSEVVQLLFRKLDDELKHLFLKESGIVFPYIKKNYHNTKKSTGNKVDPKVFDSVQHTHQTIITLIQNIRKLLNNYVVKSSSGKEWKQCVSELFTLESHIFQWIHIEQSLLYPKVINLKIADLRKNNHQQP